MLNLLYDLLKMSVLVNFLLQSIESINSNTAKIPQSLFIIHSLRLNFFDVMKYILIPSSNIIIIMIVLLIKNRYNYEKESAPKKNYKLKRMIPC
jgi:hypothetical protein